MKEQDILDVMTVIKRLEFEGKKDEEKKQRSVLCRMLREWPLYSIGKDKEIFMGLLSHGESAFLYLFTSEEKAEKKISQMHKEEVTDVIPVGNDTLIEWILDERRLSFFLNSPEYAFELNSTEITDITYYSVDVPVRKNCYVGQRLAELITDYAPLESLSDQYASYLRSREKVMAKIREIMLVCSGAVYLRYGCFFDRVSEKRLDRFLEIPLRMEKLNQPLVRQLMLILLMHTLIAMRDGLGIMHYSDFMVTSTGGFLCGDMGISFCFGKAEEEDIADAEDLFSALHDREVEETAVIDVLSGDIVIAGYRGGNFFA